MHIFFQAIAPILWITVTWSAFSMESIHHQEYDVAYQIALHEAKSDPYNQEKLLSLGFFLKKLNRYSQAIAIYEHMSPFTSHYGAIQRALSGAYLALGDFERGWPAYEYRWKNPPRYNQELKEYLTLDGSLRNKIIVLKTEYGLGDTLHFIRYAQILKNKGAHVILECQKQLIPLLSLCPYIDEIYPQGSIIPAHFFALLMSMPLILDTTLNSIPSTIPYLFADKTLLKIWREKLNTKHFKIGICWQSDPHTNSHQTVIADAQAKSIPLTNLELLANLEHVQLYSLQKINGLEQLHSNHAIVHFNDLDTTHGPFMDTAALIKQLNLVITIDTSIAHLAGGLGIPCWLLLNAGADWRWMIDRNDSPWYPTMRLFRQKKAGDWNSVIEEVITALKKDIYIHESI